MRSVPGAVRVDGESPSYELGQAATGADPETTLFIVGDVDVIVRQAVFRGVGDKRAMVVATQATLFGADPDDK